MEERPSLIKIDYFTFSFGWLPKTFCSHDGNLGLFSPGTGPGTRSPRVDKVCVRIFNLLCTRGDSSSQCAVLQQCSLWIVFIVDCGQSGVSLWSVEKGTGEFCFPLTQIYSSKHLIRWRLWSLVTTSPHTLPNLTISWIPFLFCLIEQFRKESRVYVM